MNRLALMVILLLAAHPGCATEEIGPPSRVDDEVVDADPREANTAPRPVAIPDAYVETIPGSAARFQLTPVVVDPATGAGFWMSTTEIPWEVFDGWVYGLEGEAKAHDIDGLTRPSKPYIPPDRGWGHDGFPAMAMTFASAEGFCGWLSRVVGSDYRLPTEEEWELACRAGTDGEYPFPGGVEKLADHAWYWDNADDQTHAVGEKTPNALGLHDMLGNVAEWCVAPGGSGVVRGGSFIDEAEDCSWAARRERQESWNASDPQIPKSEWWLADGPFIGLRVVRDFPVER